MDIEMDTPIASLNCIMVHQAIQGPAEPRVCKNSMQLQDEMFIGTPLPALAVPLNHHPIAKLLRGGSHNLAKRAA
jgi:hypothetical protein